MEEGVSKRMKHGSAVNGRDDKSSGIEILMAEAFVRINPTDPLYYNISIACTEWIFFFRTVTKKTVGLEG